MIEAIHKKKIQAKPCLYAHIFYELKEIALKYGYNLVLHGSMARDLDLIAIPWQEVVLPHGEMIEEFTKTVGGRIMYQPTETAHLHFKTTHHGRMQYVININRGEWTSEDPQYYLDVSVMPTIEKSSP